MHSRQQTASVFNQPPHADQPAGAIATSARRPSTRPCTSLASVAFVTQARTVRPDSPASTLASEVWQTDRSAAPAIHRRAPPAEGKALYGTSTSARVTRHSLIPSVYAVVSVQHVDSQSEFCRMPPVAWRLHLSADKLLQKGETTNEQEAFDCGHGAGAALSIAG